MGEDLSTAYKIAAGACIMVFILSIGLSLMMIGRNFWNKTADQVTTPVTSMQDTDAFFLASYEKPVPVADIWKMVMRINYGASSTDANGNISKFSIKERNPSNPNDWMLISTSVDDLDDYMARKAYMSWEVDEVTGLYTMEVSLAD